MKDKYTHIFEPLTVRTMTIKNRICMMPMGTNYGEQNGEMSFLHIDYYRPVSYTHLNTSMNGQSLYLPYCCCWHL